MLEKASRIVADTFGVTLAGSTMSWSSAVYRVALGLGGNPQATICPNGTRTSAPMAAFVNGSYAHANDFDEYYAYGPLHPGAGVWAVLPVAEWIGASGRDALEAIVLYYDICTRLAEALFHAPSGERAVGTRGFQAQALCGVFAAAASTAFLCGMNAQMTTCAFGIAGSYPGGLLEFLSDASDTKRFHFGKASAQGIVSALLARESFSGPATVFEGSKGFFHAYGGDYAPEKVLEGLGTRFDIEASVLKRWPVMGGNTSAIEALLELMQKELLHWSEIASVTVEIRSHFMPYSAGWNGDLSDRRRPANRFSAEMSLPYQLGVAAVRGAITFEDFDEARLCDREVLAFAERVEVRASAQLDAVSRLEAFTPNHLQIRTHKGKSFEMRRDHPLGDPRRPMTDGQIYDKFIDCASRAVARPQAEQVWDLSLRLAELPDVRALLAAATIPAA